MNQKYLDLGNIIQPRKLKKLFSIITLENKEERESASKIINAFTDTCAHS